MDGTAPRAETRQFHYDRATIFLHWLTAGLVAATWLMGSQIDSFPKGAPKVDARSVHFVLGIALGVVLAIRLVRWRKVSRPPPLPRAAADLVRRAGHAGLYGFLGLQVVLGLANAWGRGDSVFNLFSLPPLAPTNRAVRDFLESAHWWGAYALLAAVAAHTAVALVHHYVLRDGVLRRMLPRRWAR